MKINKYIIFITVTEMKGMILFLTLLRANVITNGAPATDHHAKVTVKRGTDCYVQMEECEESQSIEECEKEGIECSLAYFTKDETYKYIERFCSLPAFCGGAKKRHSEFKTDHSCFEDFAECAHENEGEEEEIPLDDITECQYEAFLCNINRHIVTYPDYLEREKHYVRYFGSKSLKNLEMKSWKNVLMQLRTTKLL